MLLRARLSSFRLAVVAFATVALPGCATIMHGSSQDLAIQSNPSGATVAVNGVRNAQTPATLTLPRKSIQSLEITLDGYRPFQMQLQRGTSGWVWGNIVFGGLIGLVVDASTGGMYKLTPEQISAQLESAGAQARLEDEQVYLFVTLAPESDWKLVGWLQEE